MDDDDINDVGSSCSGSGSIRTPTLTLPATSMTTATVTSTTSTSAEINVQPATTSTTTSSSRSFGVVVNHSSSSPPMTMLAAPEIPRWRFVAKAKKTEGYSSHAAGTIVQGLSAEELAGRYYNPNNTWRRNAVPDDKVIAEYILEDEDEDSNNDGGGDLRKIGKLNLNEATKDDDNEGMFDYHARRRKGRSNGKDDSDFDTMDIDDDDDDDDDDTNACDFLHPVLSADDDNDASLDQVERQEPAILIVKQQQQQQQQTLVQEALNEVVEDYEHSSSSCSTPQNPSEECKSIAASISPAAALHPSTEELPKLDVSKQLLHNEEERQRHYLKKMQWTMALVLFLTLLLAIILGITLGGNGGGKRNTTSSDDQSMAAHTSTFYPTALPSYSSSPTPTLMPIIKSSNILTTVPPPTFPPTTSNLPTMSTVPSSVPSVQPTCEKNYNDFNLCIAIDMSGSGKFRSFDR